GSDSHEEQPSEANLCRRRCCGPLSASGGLRISPLRIAQRRPLDVNGVTEVAETAQERFGHGPVAQEVGPLVIHESSGDDSGVATIALLHQLEEDVGLFRLEI